MSLKVTLVNAPSDSGVALIVNDGLFPALGINALATAVENAFPDVCVKIFDGQVYSLEELIHEVSQDRPDVLGISVLSTSIVNSLRLAEHGKACGALVVLGNDYAASRYRQILATREYVDYVCIADEGELPLISLIRTIQRGGSSEDVPGMASRNVQRILINPVPESAQPRASYMDQYPIPKRGALEASRRQIFTERYNAVYSALHGHQPIRGVATMNRARGCGRQKRRCMFCGIPDLRLRLSSPELFWRDAMTAQQEVDADVIYEAFDSFSSVPGWVARLAEARLPGAPKLFVYTQAVEVTEQLAANYRTLGVVCANMGLESGSTDVLRRLKGPRDSLEQNIAACQLLSKVGVKVYASFILGGPGETAESLDETMRFVQWLLDNGIVVALEAQPLYPDLEAPTGEWFIAPEAAQGKGMQPFSANALSDLIAAADSIKNLDIINFDHLAQLWNRAFSHADWQALLQARNEIGERARRAGVPFGSARSHLLDEVSKPTSLAGV